MQKLSVAFRLTSACIRAAGATSVLEICIKQGLQEQLDQSKKLTINFTAGKDIETAKYFENTVHFPILFTNFDNLLVHDIIHPMELHLMIGIFNYILKCLKNVLDSLNEWLINHHNNPQPYHGGQSMVLIAKKF